MGMSVESSRVLVEMRRDVDNAAPMPTLGITPSRVPSCPSVYAVIVHVSKCYKKIIDTWRMLRLLQF